jgi:hypothetical protein
LKLNFNSIRRQKMEQKKETRGAKKGRVVTWNVGRKAGVSIKPVEEKKTYRFLGYKYTKDDYEKLKKIFEKYKKENNLKTTEALKKIILNLEKK